MAITGRSPAPVCCVSGITWAVVAILTTILMKPMTVAFTRKAAGLSVALLLVGTLASTVSLAATPIGISKRLVSSTNNGDGTFAVVYEILVRNYGDGRLSEIQVEENLAVTFPQPADCTSAALESDDLTVNESYDGVDDVRLLSGIDALSIGESGTITLRLCLSPESGVASYANHATATAIDEASNKHVDQSQRGDNPDPDGDGDPGNNNESTELRFAAFEHGGSLSMSVTWSDPAGLEVSGISLTAFLSVEGFTAQLRTSFVNTGMDTISMTVNGTLGEVRLNSALAFDPSTVSFLSWQAGAAFSVAGLDVTNIVYVGTPQTASYNLLTVSREVNGMSIKTNVKGSLCPVSFSEANVCMSWPWERCDATVNVCTLFGGTDGFRSATVSVTDLKLFEDVWGITGLLNMTISYTPAEKVLTPVIRFEADWWICSEITLLSEINVSGSPLASIGTVRLLGITGECTLGDVTFSFAESLAASQNSSVTGKSGYFERLGLTGPLPSCCGSMGSFSVDAYFEGPAATLFGLGLLTGSFELRPFENFAFSYSLEYSPATSNWQMIFSFQVLW